MLHVAIQRLTDDSGVSSIGLLNHRSADVAEKHNQQIYAVDANGRRIWQNQRPVWNRLNTYAPDAIDYLTTAWPWLLDKATQAKMKILGRDVNSRTAYMQHFESADALLVSGGGFITDLFVTAERALNAILLAHSRNVPVFMLGQGIGPIESKRLWKKTRRALQHVQLIGLREKQASLPLLTKVGVDESRIRVTGDDAIELAHRQRPSRLGAEIGVNLRVAYYSEVADARVNNVGEVLRRVATAREASLIPIPIAYDGQGSDVDTITKIFEAAGEKTDGGASCKSPEDVAQAAGRCRVVVTGSYHAGVFALSQGVPVVALSKSAYYNNKFNGLADMFGTGCTVLRTDDSSFSERLSEAVHKAYVNASDVRPSLLAAARKQIEASRQAYRTMIKSLVDKTHN